MSLKYFLCAPLLQIIIALFLAFFSSNDIYFRHRPSNEDDTTAILYHQVDEDLLSIGIIIESFLLLISMIILVMAIWISIGVNYNKNVILKIGLFVSLLEMLLCVYVLIGTINFSESLISCDDFTFGKSLGCYIPIN